MLKENRSMDTNNTFIKQYFKPANKNFKKFLEQCKRALRKIGEYDGSVKTEWFSGLYDKENYGKMTVWEGLKKFGVYSFNYKNDNMLLVIDFNFEGHVYTEYQEF